MKSIRFRIASQGLNKSNERASNKSFLKGNTMASILHDAPRHPSWPLRALEFLGLVTPAAGQPVRSVTDIEDLTDRQLRDIGAARTDFGRLAERELTALHRRTGSVGPFL